MAALLILFGVLPAAEADPRIQPLMEGLAASSAAAQAAYDQAVRKADEARAAALRAARERTIEELKRLITAPRGTPGHAPLPAAGPAPGSASGSASAPDVADLIVQAEVYTRILSLQGDDPDAVRFLKAIGPLAQVLDGIKPTREGPAHARAQSEALAGGAVLSVWNQYNSGYRDRGSDQVQVQFFQGARTVHTVGPLAMPWTAGSDEHLDVPVPRDLVFDRVRVEVLSWRGAGGGLSEIQLLGHGVNLLAAWKATASESYGPEFEADRIQDGVTTSKNFAKGYWLLPDNTSGWIELTAAQTPASF